MTKLRDLFTLTEFAAMANGGMIRIQDHSSFPYSIAVYSEKAVYSKTWNEVTLQCRGLIWNNETTDIVARPFRKFFNVGETLARVDFTAPVQVADKLDGSLGISYKGLDGRTYIATKGSFESPQATVATHILWDEYPDFDPPDHETHMFEIVYPENRIVVNYGDTKDLFWLGAVDIETGKEYWDADDMAWPEENDLLV